MRRSSSISPQRPHHRRSRPHAAAARRRRTPGLGLPPLPRGHRRAVGRSRGDRLLRRPRGRRCARPQRPASLPLRHHRGGLVVAGSEAGLVDLDPEEVTHSGRLGPGQMLVVDLVEHWVYEDEALLAALRRRRHLRQAGRRRPPRPDRPAAPPRARTAPAATQRGFGYTREDVRMILQPMALDGKDAVWSMGDDTPLAFLAQSPRPLYAYFRQRFAQVTNPAIDPLREACVVSLHTRLGPWPHLLDKQRRAARPLALLALPLARPGGSPAQGRVSARRRTCRMRELPCVFRPATTLAEALDAVCAKAIELVRERRRKASAAHGPRRRSQTCFRFPWRWPPAPSTRHWSRPVCAPALAWSSKPATAATSTMRPC